MHRTKGQFYLLLHLPNEKTATVRNNDKRRIIIGFMRVKVINIETNVCESDLTAHRWRSGRSSGNIIRVFLKIRRTNDGDGNPTISDVVRTRENARRA
jgi:hypothetical protein